MVPTVAALQNSYCSLAPVAREQSVFAHSDGGGGWFPSLVVAGVGQGSITPHCPMTISVDASDCVRFTAEFDPQGTTLCILHDFADRRSVVISGNTRMCMNRYKCVVSHDHTIFPVGAM